MNHHLPILLSCLGLLLAGPAVAQKEKEKEKARTTTAFEGRNVRVVDGATLVRRRNGPCP